MRVISALVAIALIPLAAMAKDAKAPPMPKLSREREGPGGRPHSPPGQGGPAMGGGGMNEGGRPGGRPGGKDRMAPRGPPQGRAEAAPRLDMEIVNKLREAKMVPHQVATGVVEEAEALKVLSRDQLDTLIQHGKDRLAATSRGPPPMKKERKSKA